MNGGNRNKYKRVEKGKSLIEAPIFVFMGVDSKK
jgi:hypothetical protein